MMKHEAQPSHSQTGKVGKTDSLDAAPSWEHVDTEVRVGKYTLRAHWRGVGDGYEITGILNLAAAAPDLLAACEAALERFNKHQCVEGVPTCCDVMDQVEAAIQKAKQK